MLLLLLLLSFGFDSFRFVSFRVDLEFDGLDYT